MKCNLKKETMTKITSSDFFFKQTINLQQVSAEEISVSVLFRTKKKGGIQSICF